MIKNRETKNQESQFSLCLDCPLYSRKISDQKARLYYIPQSVYKILSLSKQMEYKFPKAKSLQLSFETRDGKQEYLSRAQLPTTLRTQGATERIAKVTRQQNVITQIGIQPGCAGNTNTLQKMSQTLLITMAILFHKHVLVGHIRMRIKYSCFLRL